VVVVVGPLFIGMLTGELRPELSATVSLVSLVIGATLFIWSRLLTKISLNEQKLTVESPFRRREFCLPEDIAVSHSHGGTKLVSKGGWPFFVFTPESYDLTDEQRRIVEQLISNSHARAVPNQFPQPPRSAAD